MKPSKNGVHKWSVVTSGDFNSNVKSLVHSIESLEVRKALLQELKIALAEIEHDPIGCGDPLFRYRQLDLLCCVYVSRLFVLHYSLDETRHIVYVQQLVMFE